MTKTVKLNKIRERIWRLDDDPDFTNKYLMEDSTSDEISKPNKYTFGHAIYIEGNDPQIVFGVMFKGEKPELGYFSTFENYLQRFDIANFMDILFALDSYKLMNTFSSRKAPDLRFAFKPHDICDSMFREPRGAILWHYQLENLYLFHKNDQNEAVEFRKKILKKLALTFDYASEIQIDQSTTLKDVIIARMIFGGTVRPSLKEANMLYRFLNA